jgi:putative ABC transport system permease protein
MSLWKVAWRSMQQRALASALTALSMGLGVALVVAVLVIYNVIDQSFRRGSQGYDLIVGAKGSELGLVLDTVFHLNFNQQIGNIPYSYYEEFTHGRFMPAVEAAIPVCTGHDYKGYPVVATIPEMFEQLTYLDGRKYQFAEGENFRADHYFEAVVGATAAKRTALKLGDTFRPVEIASKGKTSDDQEEEKAFKVVGILAPTGTPNDRVIFMNMEGFFRAPAHQRKASYADTLLGGAGTAKEGATAPEEKPAKTGEAAPHDDARADHDHEEDSLPREITAILVCTNEKRQRLAMALPERINREPVAQAVMPTQVITRFFDQMVGNIQSLLLVLAVLVVVVSGIGILVSMYNSMSDRRHEIAIMRALGASRWTVMAVILMESILLSLGGGALGVVLGHGLVGILGPGIAEQTGVTVAPWDFQVVELILIPGLVVLATLVGYLPAVAAYQTDVAKSLT